MPVYPMDPNPRAPKPMPIYPPSKPKPDQPKPQQPKPPRKVHSMKKPLALTVGALMALTLVVGVSAVADTEPASAHHTCSVSAVQGGPTWTKVWNGQYTSNNCRVQARLKRYNPSTGGASYHYGVWGMLTSYRYSTYGSQWHWGGRNCGRLKVPSTGYVSGWMCIN